MLLAELPTAESLTLARRDDADPAAVAWAERIIRTEVARTGARELHLVTIDGWFSQRWLAFSHKAVGAVRFAHRDLRIPPFVPSRVLAQQSFVRADGDTYYPLRRARALHVRQPSQANERRRVAIVAPDAALFWWSAATQPSGRGSLLAYFPGDGGHTGWYAEIARDPSATWRVSRNVGIGAPALTAAGFTISPVAVALN